MAEMDMDDEEFLNDPPPISADKAKRNIEHQVASMKRERARLAEKKLQFLLQQNDIFKHFGLDSSKLDDRPDKKGRGGGRQRMSEKEEDRNLLNDDSPTGTRLMTQPDVLTGQMRPYQLEGLNWLIRNHENGINGILADEMGLGKTLQSISILGYLYESEGCRGPHIILVPKSTLANWMNEIRRWCPALKAVHFHGNKDERAQMILDVLRPGQSDEDRDWNVVVTTYEVANRERTALQKFAWKFLIIDEAHRIKNENAQFSQTVRLLHTRERLLITGTPLQNNLHELWALLNFLLPDVFSDSEQFDNWFDLETDDREAKARMIGQLHKLLRPFMLRRLKADVEKSLPAKTETILYIGMSEMQKNLYKGLLTRNQDSFMNKGGGGGNRTAILNIVMQLRKCCNHPYLFQGVEDRTLDAHGEHLVQNCGKLVLLDRLLQRLKSKGHRVLIFSQMTRMLDILDDYLVMRGYPYCRIDGKTTYEEREDLIDAYNRPNSEKFVFLLSTRAGGLGINLQTADTVVLYDSDWNPQADLQAQDRAHRIGQKRPVHVYRLVTDKSIEEKVVERAHQKLKLDAMVVQQGRLQDKEKKLTKEDMLAAIKYGADHVFRSSETDLKDEDIDVLIGRGQQRTEELHKKLEKADKGDAYDFSLKFDGSFNAQQYEGVDYSDPKAREVAYESHLANLMQEEIIAKVSNERSRKTIRPAYNEADQSGEPRKIRLPNHLRLPKMEDWQFYNRERLNELHEQEETLYKLRRENKELPSGNLNQLQLLDDEQHAEKLKLLSEGFGSWTRMHYTQFIKASSKYGRADHGKIAVDVGKTEAEVGEYAKHFWEKAPSVLARNEMDNILRRVEKGEKKLVEIARLTTSTQKFLARWADPITQLVFRFVGTHGHVFGADEDRYLLVFTNRYGHGNWEKIRAEIRNSDRFRFDYYLRSLSAQDLGKRCETLMREAAKELVELDKRQVAQDELKKKLMSEVAAVKEAAAQGGVVKAGQKKNPILSLQASSSNPAKLAELRARLYLERQHELAAAAKVKEESRAAQNQSEAPKKARVASEAKTESSSANDKPVVVPDIDDIRAAIRARDSDEGGPNRDAGRFLSRPVTDDLLPDLLRIVYESKLDSRDKVVLAFINKHPQVSKRQVEVKLPEVAKKEKRNDVRAWYLKKEFEALYMEMLKTPGDFGAALVGVGPPPEGFSTLMVDEQSSTMNGAEDSMADDTSRSMPTNEPKLPRTARKLFLKHNYQEYKTKYGDKAKDKLHEEWDALSREERQPWEEKQALDQERYVAEMEAYEAGHPQQPIDSNENSHKKRDRSDSALSDDIPAPVHVHIPKKHKVEQIPKKKKTDHPGEETAS